MQAAIYDPTAFSAKDVVTIVALFLGPIGSVWLTLWSQKRSAAKNAKRHLFMTLMANRKTSPPSLAWVNALNLIDVVYAGHSKVLSQWHTLYDILKQDGSHSERYNHAFLDLLSEMATVLGYKELRQTDIDKFYTPQDYAAQAVKNEEFYSLLRQMLETVVKVGHTTQAPDPQDHA